MTNVVFTCIFSVFRPCQQPRCSCGMSSLSLSLSLMVSLLFQVWDFVIVKDESYLITGSGDMELRVWNMCYNLQVCHDSVDWFMVT